MKRIILGAFALVTAFPAGCMLPRERTETVPSASTFKVKCGGECLELEPASRSNFANSVGKVGDLLKDGRYASITTLVERNVEDAVEWLRQHEDIHTPRGVELAVARAIDCVMDHASGDGWEEYAKRQKRGNVAAAEEALRSARASAKDKHWKAVIGTLDRHEAAFKRSPYHGVHADLLRSEAARQLGKNNDAAKFWQEAVVQAAALKSHAHLPNLWDKIAGQRPVGAAWPNETFGLLRPLPEGLQALVRTTEFTPESLVWFTVGNSRLERGQVSEALTAFKRADSTGRFQEWDDFLLIHQAKALMAMQQTPAATGLLTALIERSEKSRWRAAALTLLGSGKLNDGHVDQALAFLRESMSVADASNPWHADAVANLGLAYLMTGNEAKGIESLRKAQQRFLQARNSASLLHCLENEASYWQKTGRSNEFQQVNGRIRELESAAK